MTDLALAFYLGIGIGLGIIAAVIIAFLAVYGAAAILTLFDEWRYKWH